MTSRRDLVTIALGLGSNLGDRERALRFAIHNLAAHLHAPRVSSPYSTRALCDREQPRFLNAVVVASSRLDAEELMGLAKALEWAAGRRLGPRNAARALDVDLLIFGPSSIDRPELRVPHPRLHERKFVLGPLAEIAPQLPIPPVGATAAQLLADLPNEQDVRRLQWSSAPVLSSSRPKGCETAD